MKGFKPDTDLGDLYNYVIKETGGKQKGKSWYRQNVNDYLDTLPEDDNPDDGSEKGISKRQSERTGDLEDFIVEVGEMYTFSYTAKFPQKYYAYDMFPLSYIIEIDFDGGSFLGSNLHYLSPTTRKGYAQSLINRGDGIVVPNKTIHRYLFSNVTSKIRRVPERDYVGISIMPTELFINGSGDQILSRKIWRS